MIKKKSFVLCVVVYHSVYRGNSTSLYLEFVILFFFRHVFRMSSVDVYVLRRILSNCQYIHFTAILMYQHMVK